jgi:hypothetical protein
MKLPNSPIHKSDSQNKNPAKMLITSQENLQMKDDESLDISDESMKHHIEENQHEVINVKGDFLKELVKKKRRERKSSK